MDIEHPSVLTLPPQYRASDWEYVETDWRDPNDREPAPVTLAPFPWADKPLPPEDE